MHVKNGIFYPSEAVLINGYSSFFLFIDFYSTIAAEAIFRRFQLPRVDQDPGGHLRPPDIAGKAFKRLRPREGDELPHVQLCLQDAREGEGVSDPPGSLSFTRPS